MDGDGDNTGAGWRGLLRRHGRAAVASLAVCVLSVPLARAGYAWTVLWPSAAALLVVFLGRRAAAGLLAGAVCGALLLAEGDPAAAVGRLVGDLFLPIFDSVWKLSAVAFTLLLGGFVALVEAGGGLQALVRRMIGSGGGAARRMQVSTVGLGVLVFFDGLANTMLLGRLLRGAADRCGVSRVKLAYLADATGSAVACLAFVSTWIAFQLSMIREGYAAAGAGEVNAYGLFFRSVPANFYCWLALVLALVSGLRGFNPGPMGRAEAAARRGFRDRAGGRAPEAQGEAAPTHAAFALIPILALTFLIPVSAYWIGAETLLPFTPRKFATAYGAAEAWVPQILVGTSLVAAVAAAVALRLARGRAAGGAGPAARLFVGGMRDLAGPILVLLAAWMLSGAIGRLGTADFLGEFMQGRIAPEWLPLAIFGLGALISFSTGTSWGTMAVLMPLAIPVIFTVAGGGDPVGREALVVAAVAAVFSGAVFGDHCSPFSDTTIIASIAAGVTPLDHVRTQLPFALLTALVAAVAGFLPLGFGVPSWACLAVGTGAVLVLPYLWRLWGGTGVGG